MLSMRTFLLCAAVSAVAARTRPVESIAPVPPRGISTWNTFQLFVNETLIQQLADALVPLKELGGYDILWIDDGWTACTSAAPDGRCLIVPPRVNGSIPVNADKFPSGMAALADYVHARGLRLGIYTAVSARTCGGYIGSLGYEAVDAATFISWGIDAVKHDTCGTDCGIHSGCMPNSTMAMFNALDELTDRPMLYYVDSGNPTSGQRVFNPSNAWVSDPEMLVKVATSYTELAWMWLGFPSGPRAHMFKSWFDRSDSWESFLTNAHNQIRVAEYQRVGTYNMPDYLTVGQGAQSPGQYRAQMAVWCALAAPLFLGNDIRNMDNFTRDLLTHPELLAINADPLALQGSMTSALDATEVWIKPLADASFAVAIINKSPVLPANVTLSFDWGGEFYPAQFNTAFVRDVLARQDIGPATSSMNVTVAPYDGRMLRVTPTS